MCMSVLCLPTLCYVGICVHLCTCMHVCACIHACMYVHLLVCQFWLRHSEHLSHEPCLHFPNPAPLSHLSDKVLHATLPQHLCGQLSAGVLVQKKGSEPPQRISPEGLGESNPW